jgi:hypothetical protein
MSNGEIALGLGIVDLSKTNGIKAQNLFSERFVSIVRTIPRRIALLYAKAVNITLFDPPLVLEEYNYMQIWARHGERDPFHRWLHDVVCSQSYSI